MQVGKGIEEITVLEKNSAGELSRVVLYKKKSARGKRGSKPMRFVERLLHRAARAQAAAANNYLERHETSNEKKKNGWLRDLGNNVFKAMSKGQKAMKNRDDDD